MRTRDFARLVTRTKTRKLILALLVFILVAWMSLMTMWRIESNSTIVLTNGEIMICLTALPAFVSALVLLLSTIGASPSATSAESPGASTTDAQPAPFQAQVVGLKWMNPLHRMDYPTEWQLLWTMGLVKPNPGDDMVKKKPAKFGSIQAIRAIATNIGGDVPFDRYFRRYLYESIFPFRDIYFSDERYFYNAHAIKDKSTRRELAGIHVELALPKDALDPAVASKLLNDVIMKAFDIGLPNFPNAWTHNTPPDIRITPGGANAGFTSLTQGLDYLRQHPSETVWVMNWDAPSFPLDEQIDENFVLLVLAGPTYKTGRAPLAWLSYPAQTRVADFEAQGGTPRLIQAWKAAIEKATGNAAKRPTDIGFVIHDANSTHRESSDRLVGLARSITENIPDLDFMKQTFNTSAVLGELRAGSALTNVALAIGHAHHMGKPVLVAGTTELEQPMATVVTPPAVVRPIDPNRPWFRARGMNHAYLPWWGLRHDEGPMQQGDSQ